MNDSLEIFQDAVRNFISTDFQIEVLSDDCEFTEGPVWNDHGFYLFSDITANCIYQITESGRKKIFLQNSGTSNTADPDIKSDQAGSNGLGHDGEGNLLICQHGAHAIARWNGSQLQTVINQYQGRLFNSPNDLVVHGDGRVYFSDPPYGLKEGQLNADKFQPLSGVYCLHHEKPELVCDQYQYPNGVCLSNDQKILYICSNKPFEKYISKYDTTSHRFIGRFAEENSDGIEVDRLDNIYLCSKEGIIILDGTGRRLAKISLPSIPANICWGGRYGSDLFITARNHIFLIRDLQK